MKRTEVVHEDVVHELDVTAGSKKVNFFYCHNW